MVNLETQPVGCGGLFIQWNLYIVVTLETQPVGCYTEVNRRITERCNRELTIGKKELEGALKLTLNSG